MTLLRALILLLITFSCQNKTTTIAGADDCLNICFNTDVRSLDPRIGIDYPSAFAVKMLFEGLMRIGPTGKAELAIAKSYDLSEDHKTYIFHLKDTTWSNGDPVTAWDFEYAWKTAIDPNSGKNLGVHLFYPIKNVRAIIRKEKPLDSVGITVLDERTIKIELEHPTAYFLDILATASFPIHKEIDQSDPNWINRQGTSFVCNGPFILEKHKIDNLISVVKNPHYWDAKHVKLPGIKIAVIKDTTTQLSLFEKKQLEWIGKPLSGIPLDAIEHLKEKNKIRFFETNGLYWFFVNVESFPFNHKKIRKAFAYALNRKAITNFVTLGKELPAMGLLPPRLATQNTPFFEDHNEKLALKLFHEALEELGLTKEELPTITLNYPEGTIHQRLAETFQEQWNHTFGINIVLEQQEWKTHYSKLQKGNYQIGGMIWQSCLRDPIYLMETFREKSDGVNMSQWENPTYQELLSKAENEIDPIIRHKYLNEAETLLMEEMPVIPVYFTTMAYGKNDRLKNVYISELYQVDFRWSYLEDDSKK